jgi:hypothetical protein
MIESSDGPRRGLSPVWTETVDLNSPTGPDGGDGVHPRETSRMSDIPETTGDASKFDFSAFADDTCFFDRREGLGRRKERPEPWAPPAPVERRQRKERRRRIDPTTFEKQYTPDELEFMTAMQQFKVRTGKGFPSYAEVLEVVETLGYRRVTPRELVSFGNAGLALYDEGFPLPSSVPPHPKGKP